MKKKPPLRSGYSKKNKLSVLPLKRLGQNFLTDRNIIQKIISGCQLSSEETVLEIGPGLGALTEDISLNVKKVIAVEKDARLCAALTERFKKKNVRVEKADFLKYDFSRLPNSLKVIGNLPYNISTPIISRILKNRKYFRQMFCTVQLEFGKRLNASPNSKDYSAFSCFVQYYADVKMLFKIKNTSFKPVPKVDSCFLQIDLRDEPLFKACDEAALFKTVQSAFQQRRKTIHNSLSSLTGPEELRDILKELKINPKLRAENLTLKNYVDITNLIASVK